MSQLRKQTCYLCEMPRSPWAVLMDFSEPVCRSCVNYEGPDRIEVILASARRMRGAYSINNEHMSSVKRESSVPLSAVAPMRTQRGDYVGPGGVEVGSGLAYQMSVPNVQMGDPAGFQRREVRLQQYNTQMVAQPGAPTNHANLQAGGPPGGGPDKMKAVLIGPPMDGVKGQVKPGGGPGSRPVSAGPAPPGGARDQVSSSSGNGGQREAAPPEVGPDGQPILKCTNCVGKLEDTHFVQCPSNTNHKFCFSCCKASIQKQGNEAYCPSGDRCPLQGSTVPWAFMQEEIETILQEKTGPAPQDKK